ncbi:putative membrane protein DUF2061 [Roseivirga pacifica]|uniref:Predicted membrane protein n=1 Tax=Roseivirga pacifica TaxID=1267423 RepID=A0A1I0RN31_9BACT|nr:DUF2061 domain-containing protein [Roseivirga pacifica]MCO6358305.1 DUF2061 domain-containing protein [Roseivirga pacifica]MCO6366231.1 DUF2061 domain-containing protein [Roseivirga pacifica]MCO6369218.1 DUF2061 domain-containing protein [Roseivirga pacifica]MCO6374036.1 DUF2061 domain-containing protein [Roseivirga pacifica]MCO6378412.1 DUF2061 domain-containing protein [Roseivirga pacifica]|tara:strand:+ start:909 stop:1157 length:249 start_codon:yes stop_codon:yes gene_type:complete
MLVDALVNKKIQDSTKSGDSSFKSLAKTVSWRIVGTLDTMIISYLITGELATAFSIGSIEVFTKMILYYFHERIWAGIKLRK